MARAKSTTKARKAPTKTKRASAPGKTTSRRLKTGNGGTSLEDLSAPSQDAFYLSEAAILLDQARGADGKRRDKEKMAAALERELEVWTAIRTAVLRWTDTQQKVTKENLCRLADFIAGTIMSSGIDVSDATVDTLININLQIAEGFLEGETRRHVQDQAYQIWETEGRPDGCDQDHWLRAEKKATTD